MFPSFHSQFKPSDVEQTVIREMLESEEQLVVDQDIIIDENEGVNSHNYVCQYPLKSHDFSNANYSVHTPYKFCK